MSLPKKWNCFSDFKPTIDFLFISKYANTSNMVQQHHNYIDTIHIHQHQYPPFPRISFLLQKQLLLENKKGDTNIPSSV